MGPHVVGRAFKESLTALHMLPVEDPCKPKSLHFQQILDQEHGWVEVAIAIEHIHGVLSHSWLLTEALRLCYLLSDERSVCC